MSGRGWEAPPSTLESIAAASPLVDGVWSEREKFGGIRGKTTRVPKEESIPVAGISVSMTRPRDLSPKCPKKCIHRVRSWKQITV